MINDSSQTSTTDPVTQLENEIDGLLASIDDNIKRASEMMADNDESESDRADRLTEQIITTDSSPNQPDPATPANTTPEAITPPSVETETEPEPEQDTTVQSQEISEPPPPDSALSDSVPDPTIDAEDNTTTPEESPLSETGTKNEADLTAESENTLDLPIDAAVMQAATSLTESAPPDTPEDDTTTDAAANTDNIENIEETPAQQSEESPAPQPPKETHSAPTEIPNTNDATADSTAADIDPSTPNEEDLAEMLADAIQEVTQADETDIEDHDENPNPDIPRPDVNNDNESSTTSPPPEPQTNAAIKPEAATINETTPHNEIDPNTNTEAKPAPAPAPEAADKENLEELDRMLEEAAGQVLSAGDEESLPSTPAEPIPSATHESTSATSTAPDELPPSAEVPQSASAPNQPAPAENNPQPDTIEPASTTQTPTPPSPNHTTAPAATPIQRIASQFQAVFSKIPHRDKPLQWTTLALSKANKPWQNLPPDLQLGVIVITASSFLLGILAIFIAWHRAG